MVFIWFFDSLRAKDPLRQPSVGRLAQKVLIRELGFTPGPGLPGVFRFGANRLDEPSDGRSTPLLLLLTRMHEWGAWLQMVMGEQAGDFPGRVSS